MTKLAEHSKRGVVVWNVCNSVIATSSGHKKKAPCLIPHFNQSNRTMQSRRSCGTIQKEWRSEDEGQVALVFLPQAMLNRLSKLSHSELFLKKLVRALPSYLG